eukprot:COSAG06_NODE_113_length_23458_cov_74.739715_13_plen_257_part_00
MRYLRALHEQGVPAAAASMADRGSLLLTGGGGAGDEGSEQPQPELPGWRAHVSPELAGKWASTQAKAKALVAMDPRDAYRALSDPSDPVHENMPLLRPDSRTPLGAPVVEATVGHPTPKEMRAGFCSACCGACGFIIVALVVAGGIFASSSAVACTQAAGNAKMDAVPAGCRRQKQLGDGMEEDFSIPQINDPLPMTMATPAATPSMACATSCHPPRKIQPAQGTARSAQTDSTAWSPISTRPARRGLQPRSKHQK